MPQVYNAEQTAQEFEQFYNQYYLQAYKFTCKRIRNVQDAEDIVSESFCYCYQHFSNFDPTKSSFGTWLFLVLISRIKNHYRDKKENVDLDSIAYLFHTDADAMVDAIHLVECRDALAKAIKQLPEQQQKIVILTYFHHKKSADIASQLGLSPGNVRTILSRALRKLEMYYSDLIHDERG